MKADTDAQVQHLQRLDTIGCRQVRFQTDALTVDSPTGQKAYNKTGIQSISIAFWWYATGGDSSYSIILSRIKSIWGVHFQRWFELLWAVITFICIQVFISLSWFVLWVSWCYKNQVAIGSWAVLHTRQVAGQVEMSKPSYEGSKCCCDTNV